MEKNGITIHQFDKYKEETKSVDFQRISNIEINGSKYSKDISN